MEIANNNSGYGVEQAFAWRLGGPQGSGIDTLATLFTLACAHMGMQVHSRREYHSNIKGRHSYYDLSFATQRVYSHAESPDMAVCLDSESICRHALVLKPGGCLLYPEGDLDTSITRLDYLDESLRQTITHHLAGQPAEITVGQILEFASGNGIRCLGIPLKPFNKILESELGLKKQVAERLDVTLMVCVSAALLGIPVGIFDPLLLERFSPSPVADCNRRACELAYEHVRDSAWDTLTSPLMHRPAVSNTALLLNGYQGAALGKLSAGLDFQTYYPISPATDESEYLQQCLPSLADGAGGIVPTILQVEDELAAINMASGAALTGKRCATATSGPGFSLMAEGLGWAGMNEIPLVVSLYQRGGPSTGLPTRTEQGDLLFSIFSGHGEFPRMVLASGDVEECFYDAASALDYAARYQLPVIHLLDKHLTSCVQTTPVFECSAGDHGVEKRPSVDGKGDTGAAITRFGLTHDGISPRPHVGRRGEQFWTSGAEHDTSGGVSEDPQNREQMMEKRARKLQQVLNDMPLDEKLLSYGDETAPVTVLFWGSVKGAALDAMHRLSRQGKSVHLLQLRLLWPFPVQELLALLPDKRRLIVVENNYSGQMATLLQAQTGRRSDHLVVKYSGRPISGEGLAVVLDSLYNGHPERRWVLRNPFE